MKTRSMMLALALGLGMVGAANAQVISYSPRTGDVWMDNELGYYNGYGRDYRDNYVDDIVGTFGAPRSLVSELLTTRRWNPGDVYYACALAYQTRRGCGEVVNMYDQNKGQGWGVVAQRLGIKPGSAEFHALKGQMGKSRSRYTTYATAHGKSVRIDDGSAPGNSGNKGNGNAGAKGKGNAGGKGNGNGNGNGNKGGKGKGH